MSYAPRILIVDDEPRMCDSLKTLLSDQGYEIHTSHSGKNALEYLAKNDFDLVILDMFMPDVDGSHVMDHINRQSPDTLIIVMTGHASVESAVTALKGGAYDYLTKPFEHERLLKKVQNALDHKALKNDRKGAEEALELERRQLLSIFDGIDHPVYVSDPDTYEVLYSNLTLKEKFGDVIGQKCYRAFQSMESPCPFCTNEHIFGENAGQPYIWEFQNKINHRWYHCIDRAIRWTDGRLVRHEVAIDITQRRQAEEALQRNEARYRELVQNANSIIFRRDTQGKITFFNEFAQDFFGYTEDEIVGRNVIGTIVPEIDSAGRNLAAMIQDIGIHPERYATNENENMRRNGERVWIAWTNKAVRDKDGNILEILSVGNDITQRKQAEEATQQSEQRFREMAALLPTIICEMDTDLRVTYMNEVGLEKLGYSQDDFDAGIHGMDLIHPGDREKAANGLDKTIQGEGIGTAEYRLLRKDGPEMPALLNSAVMYKDRTRIGFRTTATDITEQKKLERQLRQAQKMEGIGTLAGGIAHDFNNLLMGIQGHVSLMLMDMDPTHPDYERLKNIEKRVQSGARLTSHLLGYARKGKYEVKPVPLNKLVEETSDTFGRTKKEIRIQRELAEDLCAVEADPGQIEQVLLNLFVNAADAMPGGGDLILKTMNVTHEDMKGKLYDPKPGNYAMLAVTDTGIGMDKETIERIFDPFFTTKEMGRGTGLGLASAYGILKAHGGYIDVDSQKGQGTTFNIYLPASEKRIQEAVRGTDQIIRGSETVLLVDDEEAIRQVGQELLETMGYRVLLANDGKEAVELYQKNRNNIDMVLLDMVMPNMGGGEAYDRMKEINPDIKVLLSSGYSIEGEATQILERGCNGFIQKPFTMKKLSGKIRGILGKA
jgi:PAS domain S-box-containing protein